MRRRYILTRATKEQQSRQKRNNDLLLLLFLLVPLDYFLFLLLLMFPASCGVCLDEIFCFVCFMFVLCFDVFALKHTTTTIRPPPVCPQTSADTLQPCYCPQSLELSRLPIICNAIQPVPSHPIASPPHLLTFLFGWVWLQLWTNYAGWLDSNETVRQEIIVRTVFFCG